MGSVDLPPMWHFHPKLFVALVFGFIGFTIVGTLSHEAGHWIVARWYGFDATVHYGYTDYGKGPSAFERNADSINALRDKYKLIQKRGERYFLADSIDFPKKIYYETLIREQQQILLPIDAGGPIQTILTGLLGLGVLMLNRRWWQGQKTLSMPTWLAIFATLFWLRQSFNLVMATYRMVKRGRWSSRMDEFKIANTLHLWPASISLVTGLVGFGVLAWVTLRVIPKAQRLTFLAGGLVGGLFGFWLWLRWLGPKVLP